MEQSIDCQPHFGHQVGLRKASYANYAAQVGEKTAICLLSDRLLERNIHDDIYHYRRVRAGAME
jgi:phosphopantetheine adenylyltransferase